MALISCPDCGKQVSDRAASCPECGHPINKVSPTPTPVNVVVEPPPSSGSGCGGGFFFVLLIIAGVAAVATKPDEAAMKKAIVQKHGVGFGIGAAVGEAIGTTKFTYHDYFIFSRMTQKGLLGEQRTIATGIFGQVFVNDL